MVTAPHTIPVVTSIPLFSSLLQRTDVKPDGFQSNSICQRWRVLLPKVWFSSVMTDSPKYKSPSTETPQGLLHSLGSTRAGCGGDLTEQQHPQYTHHMDTFHSCDLSLLPDTAHVAAHNWAQSIPSDYFKHRFTNNSYIPTYFTPTYHRLPTSTPKLWWFLQQHT